MDIVTIEKMTFHILDVKFHLLHLQTFCYKHFFIHSHNRKLRWVMLIMKAGICTSLNRNYLRRDNAFETQFHVYF